MSELFARLSSTLIDLAPLDGPLEVNASILRLGTVVFGFSVLRV